MKTNVSNKKAIASGILVVAIIVATVLVFANKSLNKKLADEKLKSEILLSEKLSMDKLVSKYQDDLKNLGDKNKMLDKMTADANMEVLSKNKEIEKLRAERQSARNFQKKIDELALQNHELNKELKGANKSLADANAANTILNKQLASASAANTGLVSDNSILKAIISDNYRTEAFRGKREKLTVNAKKTDKLLVSFDMSDVYGEKIYFKIVTPEGNEFHSNKDLAANMTITSNGDGLLAGDINAAGPAATKRVEMTYHPLQKLSKGIYQFNIYNEDRFLGSTQLRLK